MMDTRQTVATFMKKHEGAEFHVRRHRNEEME